MCLQKLEMQLFRGHLLKIKNNGDHPHFNVSYYAFSAKLNFLARSAYDFGENHWNL